MKEVKTKVELKLTRKVRTPKEGLHSFVMDSKSIFFTYGKGGDYKNVKEALEAAREVAPGHVTSATSATLTVWNGTKKGKVETLKDSDQMFTHKFLGATPPPTTT